MKAAARDSGVEVHIEALPVSECSTVIDEVDIVLLGSQVRFQKPQIDKLALVLIIIMIFNSALNTKKKGNSIKNQFTISFIAIIIGTGITLGMLLISGAIKFKSSEVIPIAGMIVSNSMVAIGLSYRNLNSSFKSAKAEVEVKLSLGADIKEASKDIIKDSIKVSIMPTIDAAKTLGIVSLPGMMTGLILGGTSPLVSVKFQIMVTFMILSAASMATMISTYLSYKLFFMKENN